MQRSIKTQITEIMNWNNLPGAKCVLLRYQKRSIDQVHRGLVLAFTLIKCKRKGRKTAQLLGGYPNFILRLLLFSALNPLVFFTQFCLFSVIFLSSSVMFLLPCFSFQVILVSWNGNWLPVRPTQGFAIYFCLSPVEKGLKIPFLPTEESISNTKAAAASRQRCTIVTYITYSLSASRH